MRGIRIEDLGDAHQCKQPERLSERRPKKSGFAASVIEDATRGIDAGGSLGKAWQDMTGAGVKRITSADIELP